MLCPSHDGWCMIKTCHDWHILWGRPYTRCERTYNANAFYNETSISACWITWIHQRDGAKPMPRKVISDTGQSNPMSSIDLAHNCQEARYFDLVSQLLLDNCYRLRSYQWWRLQTRHTSRRSTTMTACRRRATSTTWLSWRCFRWDTAHRRRPCENEPGLHRGSRSKSSRRRRWRTRRAVGRHESRQSPTCDAVSIPSSQTSVYLKHTMFIPSTLDALERNGLIFFVLMIFML